MARTTEFWFITGSQHLYGPEALQQVEEQARKVVLGLGHGGTLAFPLVFKPIVTTSEQIHRVMLDANSDDSCAGVIVWMHTFSPSQMWIHGLAALQKPMLHLHTQFHQDIPFDSIDMDFMNLNQSAHGDREFGFMVSRMKIARKVVVGHWADASVQDRIGAWMRTVAGYTESKQLKVARFGDNMRNVAVTEGDKVEAQVKLGWSVRGYGVGDLVERVNAVTDAELSALLDVYASKYDVSLVKSDADKWASVQAQARIEIGIRHFLEDGGFGAFTTTFEDLHGLAQLPGLAAQNLMADGYGFGGEGDWKASALTRIMKVMAGFEGTSFMEDYTYHLNPANPMVLGSHMLEVCPTIAATRPRIEVHPLSIGDKADPARIVFDGQSGPAIVASLVDLGGRLRLIINQIEAVAPIQDMPKLPVARVFWKPAPSLSEAAEAWIYAGGSHHTVFSSRVTAEQMMDFAEMMGIESILIDKHTSIWSLKKELKWGDLAWRLN